MRYEPVTIRTEVSEAMVRTSHPALAEKAIWITWENQRRSLELAAALGADLWLLLADKSYLVRAVWLGMRTIGKLLARRPRLVFVQNPSLVLATLVCFLRPLLGYRLVVDRHSSFKFHTRGSPLLKYRIFHRLSRYTVRHADLTIVTNEFLRDVIERWGGRGFVLQDRLPDLSQVQPRDLAGNSSIVFICSHNADEPLAPVVAAARLIDPRINVYVTGNYHKTRPEVYADAPANIVFTGFLSEVDYQSLLHSSDALMALTIQPHTLLCGAYEAVALGKPLVLSDFEDLTSYFDRGTVFTDNSPESIAAAITQAITDKDRLGRQMRELQDDLSRRWQVRFAELVEMINAG